VQFRPSQPRRTLCHDFKRENAKAHIRISLELKMTDNNEVAGSPEPVPESLRILAVYLERSLDKATSIVMMRHTTDACTVYLGDLENSREDLKQTGTITIPVANGILDSTSSGANTVQIEGQVYRFVRSFAQVGGMAAVVFSTN
jgi:hypothetical protein